MGTIADGWRSVKVNGGAPEVSTVPLGELVEVAELLRGKLMPAGLEWDRPPLALKIQLEGSIARFCFASNDCPSLYWGSTDTLADGLLDVEEALCKEHGRWSKNQWYKNGLSYHRK